MQIFSINYDKARDACSIVWESDDHAIHDLEPYIFAIQCDDGQDFQELISSDWPYADGKDDFTTIELNNFAALEGDQENEFLLCFNAKVRIDLSKYLAFASALEQSNHQIIARIQFKKDGEPLLDENGDEVFLYELHRDNYVEFCIEK